MQYAIFGIVIATLEGFQTIAKNEIRKDVMPEKWKKILLLSEMLVEEIKKIKPCY